jgi:hypothetical protein
MAVPEQTPYKEYAGNGVTTNFALGFTCDLKRELKVFINDIESELSTWSLTSGSVSFTTAPALGSKIAFKRATKLERTTNYLSSNNSFRPEAINKDFDRVWYAIQDQNYKVGQYDYDYNFVLTQVRPIATGGTGADNPNDARNNLNTYSKEEVNALIATSGEGNVVGVAGGGTGAATVAEARTNLGVMSSTEVENAINSATPQATETALGVAEVATLVETLSGLVINKIVTPYNLAQTVFGMNQKNKLKTVVSGTTYTHSNDKPSFLSISMSGSSGTSAIVRHNGNILLDTGSSGRYTVSILVAKGDTYYISGGSIVCMEYS